jgi:hypothetical protein
VLFFLNVGPRESSCENRFSSCLTVCRILPDCVSTRYLFSVPMFLPGVACPCAKGRIPSGVACSGPPAGGG